MNETTLRYPKSAWILPMFTLGLVSLVLASSIIATFYVIVWRYDWQFIAMLGTLSAVLYPLWRLVCRDGFAKMRWRIDIGPEVVALQLPAYRSISFRRDAVTRTLARSEIAAIEYRLEAYSSFGMANLQRSYALRLKSGELIILGEDRGIGTNIEDSNLSKVAEILAENLAIGFREKPMVRGEGGLLSTWFVRAPAWDAQPLDAAGIERVRWQTRLTGNLPLYVWLAAVLLSAIFGA